MTSRKATTIANVTDATLTETRGGGIAVFAELIGVLKDDTPPVIALISPANESTIGPTQAITVTAIDADPGILRVVISVTYTSLGLETTEVVHDGAFHSNFTDPPNARTSISNGFQYVFTRDDEWFDGDLDVRVRAIDIDGNETVENYSFTVNNPAGAVFSSVTPLTPTTIQAVFGVAMNTGDGELGRAANYQVRGIGGTPPDDRAVLNVSVTNATTVVITVEEMLDDGDYELVVANINTAGGDPIPTHDNANQEPFTGLGAAPSVTLVSPTDGATSVARGAQIVIDITDSGAGVNLGSVVVQVEGVDAYKNSAFQTGFTGPASLVSTIAGGYRITIDPSSDFGFGQTVNISVTGMDNAGNAIS